MKREGPPTSRSDMAPASEASKVTRDLPYYWRSRIGRAAMKFTAGLCLALAPVQVVQADIRANELSLEVSAPEVHTILEADEPNHRDRATVFIDGFGGQDGSGPASEIADSLQIINDSNIWALEYAKNGLSSAAIAEQIAQKAEQEHITSISLYGYSIGGMLALETARELSERYGLTVSAIFLDHSPADRDTIRQTMRDQASPAIDTIEWFHAFGIDIEYSSLARGVVDNLFAENISHLKKTPINLMRDQYLYGVEAQINEFIAALGHAEHRPTIVYVTSSDPSSDYMVDVANSQNVYQILAYQYSLPFFIITVDGAIHSRIDLTVPQYTDAFTSASEALNLSDQQQFGSSTAAALDGGHKASTQQHD